MKATETAAKGRRSVATPQLLEPHLRRIAEDLLRRLRTANENRDRLVVSAKSSADDLVTDADRAIETWLWEETHRAFPEDGFLGEEHGWRLGPTFERDWIVDPIDGTSNFASGLPWACSSVAAVVSGLPFAGFVVDPYRGDVYMSVAPDRPSELNGEPTAVAPGDELGGKIVLLEVPSGTPLSVLGAVEQAVRARGATARAMGSGALALALVAAGRAQAVVHAGPSIWDVAAGVALIEHAGGTVLGTEGRYELGAPGPLVAGSRESCELLLAALATADLSSVAGPPSLEQGRRLRRARHALGGGTTTEGRER